MFCPKCGTEVIDDALFCAGCGANVSEGTTADYKEPEDMEKTMAIPLSKIREMEEKSPGMVLHSEPAPAVKPVKPAPKTRVSPAPVPAGKSGKNTALICAVVFLATVVIVLASALAFVLTRKDNPYEEVIQSSDAANTVSPEQSISQETPVEPEEFPEGESVVVEEIRGIRIDSGFEFSPEVVLDTENAGYKTLEGADYKCNVPSDFEFVYESDGEIRYAQTENTAYMDIGVIENPEDVSMDEIRSKAIGDIGGALISSSGGDNWYSITAEKDSIIYHHKCFVSGGTVLYYEMVYPSVYGEIYGTCISDIDTSFEMIQ